MIGYFAKSLAVLLMLLGLGMVAYSSKYRLPNSPPYLSIRPSWRTGKPIWQRRDWYKPGGYKILMYGWIIFFVGMMLEAIIALR